MIRRPRSSPLFPYPPLSRSAFSRVKFFPLAPGPAGAVKAIPGSAATSEAAPDFFSSLVLLPLICRDPWRGQHYKFHVHPFVILAADDRADHYVLARLAWRHQGKFLDAWFQHEVPPVNGAPIFRTKQGKAVNGAIAIHVFRLLSCDSQGNRLPGPDRDDRLFLSGHFVSAVVVRLPCESQ